jgi:hypothetical protein
MVTTIAGTGSPGISGDGGLATNAQVGNFLCGIAVDDQAAFMLQTAAATSWRLHQTQYPLFGDSGATSCSGHRIRRITQMASSLPSQAMEHRF